MADAGDAVPAALMAASLEKFEKQLGDIVKNVDPKAIGKAVTSAGAPVTILGKVFVKVSPMLGPLMGIIGPMIKEQFGMVEASLKPVMKLLNVVKELQTQTLNQVEAVLSEIQNLDGIKAQERLEGYISDIEKLSKYKLESAFNKESERIRAEVKQNARRDLRFIQNALMGKKDGNIGLARDGLYKSFYNRQYRRFDDSPDYSMVTFAKALDAYLCTAMHLQWTYFLMWSATCTTEDDLETQRVEAESFTAALTVQEQTFMAMRPLSMNYFLQTPTSVSTSRNYHLHHGKEYSRILWDVCWSTDLGPSFPTHNFEFGDDAISHADKDPRSSMATWDASADFQLEEWQIDQYPLRSLLTGFNQGGGGGGSSMTAAELPDPAPAYHGSGYVALRQGSSSWCSLFTVPALGSALVPRGTSRVDAARLQVVPLQEWTLGDDGLEGKMCVRLRHTGDGRTYLAKMYGDDFFFVLEDLGEGPVPPRKRMLKQSAVGQATDKVGDILQQGLSRIIQLFAK